MVGNKDTVKDLSGIGKLDRQRPHYINDNIVRSLCCCKSNYPLVIVAIHNHIFSLRLLATGLKINMIR